MESNTGKTKCAHAACRSAAATSGLTLERRGSKIEALFDCVGADRAVTEQRPRTIAMVVRRMRCAGALENVPLSQRAAAVDDMAKCAAAFLDTMSAIATTETT